MTNTTLIETGATLAETGNTCSRCFQPIRTEADSVMSGYGRNRDGKIFCYACCADIDKADMIATGKTTLYLIVPSEFLGYRRHIGDHVGSVGRGIHPLPVAYVGNWPNSLTMSAYVRKGRHNIAGTRYDAWFDGPDGYVWHGVCYGEDSQLCHCKRTKERSSH